MGIVFKNSDGTYVAVSKGNIDLTKEHKFLSQFGGDDSVNGVTILIWNDVPGGIVPEIRRKIEDLKGNRIGSLEY